MEAASLASNSSLYTFNVSLQERDYPMTAALVEALAEEKHAKLRTQMSCPFHYVIDDFLASFTWLDASRVTQGI